MTGDEIATMLYGRLSRREPASVVRLGDGEGLVLARPRPEDRALWPAVRAHFGPHVSAGQVARLAGLLELAIRDADVIGVREDLLGVRFGAENFELGKDEFLPRFRASFNLRPAEADISYPGAMRLAILHRYLSDQKFRRDTVFASAWLHFHLSASGALVDMLRSQRRIGLIGSKGALVGKLEELLGIAVDYYEVPDMFSLAPAGASVHFPDRFERVMQRLRVASRGQLFLVGAGICGKVYCQRVKELGGIGLDIGAVCDAWLGIASRPLVFESLYGGDGTTVPEVLLLDRQIVSRRAAGFGGG